MTNFMGTADLNRAHPINQNLEGGHEAAIDSARHASEAPGVTELTAPTPKHSSPVPQSNVEDRKHAHLLKGKSERSMRRQKKALRDLQAQGFQTLPDFFRKKAEDADKKAKFEAMVASVKAKLKALQVAEEEEASSETETETEDQQDVEVISEPDTSWDGMPRDKTRPQSPDTAAAPHTRGATLEPGGAEEMTKDSVVWMAGSSSTTYLVEQEGTIHSGNNLDAYLESSHAVFEEEEDGSDDDQTLDKRNESGNGCAMEEQRTLEDTWDTVSQMLEDLRHMNEPKDSSHPQPADSFLELLRDRVALRTAQEELASLVREKKPGDFVHRRILAKEAVLNIFLDEDLGLTWTKASIIVAKSQGHGTTRARTIQEWVITFL
ncbi:hypothetical protein V8E53_001821 [Lactarius tabidus]